MKNLLTTILLTVIVTTNSYSQTPPVAVNDTFYTYFETSITKFRSDLYANDSAGIGGLKIVDTVIYSGGNQFVPTYFTGGTAWLGLNKFVFTPQTGYFGLDSLTYVLTENGNPTFDTATIYIYVKRKGYENLDLNNISADINNVSLFQNQVLGPVIAGFNVPKQINVGDPYYSTIYAANLWVAGEDINGQIKTFAPMFGNDDANNSSSLPHTSAGDAGPINIESGFYSYKWDRVWKVSQSEIDYHITNYSLGGYTPIEVIENWPAHGDTSKGKLLI